MSIRKVVKYGTPSLREPSKEVHKVSQKIKVLVEDLLDTMYSQNGVGLAAPQIGENLRIFVIDVSTNNEPLNPMVFINPKIIKKSGAVISHEGCLSFPEAFTDVKRYANVMVKAMDRNGRSFVLEAKDGTLLESELSKNNLPPLELDKILDEPDLEPEIEKLLEERVKQDADKKD